MPNNIMMPRNPKIQDDDKEEVLVNDDLTDEEGNKVKISDVIDFNTYNEELLPKDSFGDTGHQNTFSTKSFSDSQLNEMDDKGINRHSAYQDGFDLNKELTDRQSGVEAIGRAVGVGAVKGALSAIENTGYMLSVWDWANFDNDFNDNATNLMSDWATEQKKDLSEWAPIYSEGMYDFGFWAQMLESTVDSTVGFSAPGGIAGKAIGRGARFLHALSKIKGGAKLVNGLSTVATGFLSNYAESSMMGKDLYDNVYQKARQSGVSDEDAKAAAYKAKKDFLIENKIWALTDMAALHNTIGPSKLSGAAEKSKLFSNWKGTSRRLGNYAADGALEAVEEVGGDFIQSVNEKYALGEIGIGKKDTDNYVERILKEDWTKDSHITSAIGGITGGPFQAGLAKVTSKITDATYEKLGINDVQTDPGEFKREQLNLSDYVEGDVVKDPGTKKTHKEWLLEKEPDLKGAKLEGRLKETSDSYHKDYSKEYEDQSKKYEDQAEGRKNYDRAISKQNEDEIKWNNNREEIKKANAKKEEYKKTGKIENTKKEVAEYIANDAKLTEEYLKAYKESDISKMTEIEERKVQNLIYRHAVKGSLMSAEAGDGSLENALKNAISDTTLTEEEKNNAQKLLDKLPSNRDGFNKLTKDLEGNQEAIKKAWDIRGRTIALREVSADAKNRERVEVNNLIKELEQTNDVNSSEVEVLTLSRELVILDSIKKEKGLSDKQVKSIEKRQESIRKKVEELKENKEYFNNGLSKETIQNAEAFKRLDNILSQKHDSIVASEILTEQYNEFKKYSPKQIEETHKNHFESKIENATSNNIKELKNAIQSIAISKGIKKKTAKSLLNQIEKKESQLKADEIKETQRKERLIRQKANAETMMEKLKVLRSKELGLVTQEDDRKLSKKERARQHQIESELHGKVLTKEERQEKREADRNERLGNIDTSYEHYQQEYDIADELLLHEERSTDYSDAYEAESLEFERRIAEDKVVSEKQVQAVVNTTESEEVKNAARDVAAEKRKTNDKKNDYYGPTNEGDHTLEPPIPKKINNQEKVGKKKPHTLGYMSPSDGFKGYVDNGSTIHTILEDGDIDKVGREFEIEVDGEDIKLHLLTDGKRKEGEFAFLRKDDKESSNPKELKAMRDMVFKAHKEGTLGKVRPKIKSVNNGYLNYKEGVVNNPAVVVGKDASEIQLVINDGDNYIDEQLNPVKVKNDVNFANRGFVHAMFKTASGNNFPLRLNSRKLKEQEANAIYEVILNRSKGAGYSDKINVTGIKGNLTNEQLLEIMIFEGAKSVDTLYPFNYTAKGLEIDGRKIAKKDIEANRDVIIDYLQGMWRTTQSKSMNRPLKSSYPDIGKVEWFGEIYDFDTMHYNDFMFNEEALSTNVTAFPTEKLFIQPITHLTHYSSWGFESKGSKSKVKKKQNEEFVEQVYNNDFVEQTNNKEIDGRESPGLISNFKNQKKKQKTKQSNKKTEAELWNTFVDTGKVPQSKVKEIISKIVNGETLTDKELSIRTSYAEEIETELKKQPTKETNETEEFKENMNNSGSGKATAEDFFGADTYQLENENFDLLEEGNDKEIEADVTGDIVTEGIVNNVRRKCKKK